MYLFLSGVRGKGEFSVRVSEVNGLVDTRTRTPKNHSRVGMHCSKEQIIILSRVPLDYYKYS